MYLKDIIRGRNCNENVTATDITPRHIDIKNLFGQTPIIHHKEAMEQLYASKNLKIIDHFAQDGMAPLLSNQVDQWNESEFDVWCQYHYGVCREPSILGASNHVIIIGKKSFEETKKR